MAIYDCVMFYNELDMLETRMHILNDVVDYFVVCEAPETHSGKEKPMYFWEALKTVRFDEWRNKIIYVNAGFLSNGHRDSWQRERYHRAQISEGLYGCRSDDYVLVCDCDEIPHPGAIREVVKAGYEGAMLPVKTFYYDLTHEVSYPWGMGMVRWRLGHDPNRVRTGQDLSLPTIPIFGWHLSYFGGVPAIVDKLGAFMHHGDLHIAGVADHPDFIEQQVRAVGDLFGRTLVIEERPIGSHLPQYILEHLDHYVKLGWVK
jgi:beta-1,4-mannosyl-glycoprotein beta-1,4-N-acetylglucosaminyltransferase